jgi:hypothetical protein
MTKAVATIIQAVSPESILLEAGAGAGEGGAGVAACSAAGEGGGLVTASSANSKPVKLNIQMVIINTLNNRFMETSFAAVRLSLPGVHHRECDGILVLFAV